jgi:hypothetical protein
MIRESTTTQLDTTVAAIDAASATDDLYTITANNGALRLSSYLHNLDRHRNALPNLVILFQAFG